MFVVFDGVDGAGKGTAVKGAKNFLLSKGVPEEKIVHTAEPTNGFYGKKVRELLASSPKPELNAKQFLDLYVADRKEHLEKVIDPALRENKIVLCDRFKHSTFVYQHLQGIPLEKIRELHEGMATPDLVFILDLPVEVAMKRIMRRKKLDTFERAPFMEKVRQGFLGLKAIFPREDIVFIDASKSIGEVRAKIGSVLWNKVRGNATTGNRTRP